MKNLLIIYLLLLGMLSFACSKTVNPAPTPEQGVSTEVRPVDVNQKGFELLEKMQGHWQGRNKVLAWDWDWFAFDYRPISPSHVFGIHEGGSMGNLLTSFFVSDYKGTQTIMARNGGVLSGIYRISYFVLDSVRNDPNRNYYRLVDAIGGAKVMYMELEFSGDSLNWSAYTSRLGENMVATRHMAFQGVNTDRSLAQTAADQVGFPKNEASIEFTQGFNTDYLYVAEGESAPLSASFLAQGNENDVFTLGQESGDPFPITEHPQLALLEIDFEKSTQIKDDRLMLYLSDEALTDENGFISAEAFNSILHFPELEADAEEFQFTYLHPGTYYLTVIADHNGDQLPGSGDISSKSQKITVLPEGDHTITLSTINIQL
ncbi:MAG: hypothetical protein AAGD28_02065 [Bacteroidota bacterium]